MSLRQQPNNNVKTNHVLRETGHGFLFGKELWFDAPFRLPGYNFNPLPVPVWFSYPFSVISGRPGEGGSMKRSGIEPGEG